MPRTRPPYPAEFRAEAVRLVHASGRKLKDVAADLGVSEQALRSWVKQADLDTGRRDDGLTTSEREELRRLRPAGPCAGGRARNLAQGRGVLRQGDRSAVSCYRLIEAEKARHAVSRLCRVLGVSRAGYYAWSRRGPSARAQVDQVLTRHIRAIHRDNRGLYGAPRIHAELRYAHGLRVGRKRVARLMRVLGLQGAHRRKLRGLTRRDPAARPAPDLLDRQFAADRPDAIWTADITEVPTGEGKLYFSVVLDLFSRETYYNPRRRHSTLGYFSPLEHERRYHRQQARYPAA